MSNCKHVISPLFSLSIVDECTCNPHGYITSRDEDTSPKFLRGSKTSKRMKDKSNGNGIEEAMKVSYHEDGRHRILLYFIKNERRGLRYLLSKIIIFSKFFFFSLTLLLCTDSGIGMAVSKEYCRQKSFMMVG